MLEIASDISHAKQNFIRVEFSNGDASHSQAMGRYVPSAVENSLLRRIFGHF
jgi:hypothetical protein